MSDSLHEYRGQDVVVRWDEDVCIHAAECVRGLPRVFDTEEKPWIRPDAATEDEIADVIALCPSGALSWARVEPATPPLASAPNTVRVGAGGPYVCQGDFDVLAPDGTLLRSGPRMALCRCGHSANKPFCDGSHAREGFSDPGRVEAPPPPASPPEAARGKVKVTAARDGPFLLAGAFDLKGEEGELHFRAGRAALCRCGQSGNRPLCDGTHKRVGFRA